MDVGSDAMSSRTFISKGELRFAYAICKTREKAEAILEDMFASGDVCNGERPQVEPFSLDHRRKAWCVSLPA